MNKPHSFIGLLFLPKATKKQIERTNKNEQWPIVHSRIMVHWASINNLINDKSCKINMFLVMITDIGDHLIQKWKYTWFPFQLYVEYYDT